MAGVNYATLSLAQTPPLAVPLRFILTAPLFAAAAGLLLILYGDDVFVTRWAPWTLALTHLITLGFLASIMVGAVQQLLPVLLGASIPRANLFSAVLHGLLTLGTVALVAGLTGSSRPSMAAAAVLLGSAFLLFSLVVGWCLVRARSGHATRIAMALSLVALVLNVTLGVNLAIGYAGAVQLARHTTDVHLALGLLGWVGLLVMGVAYQVVPMFQITPSYPRWVMTWLAPVTFLALLAWAAAHLIGGMPAPLVSAAAVVLGAGYVLFAATTLWLQHRRKRRLPDVTLDFWRVGMISLLLSVLVWAAGALSGEMPALALGILFLVGFAMSVVNGMLYKIVPFLVWLHLNNRRQVGGRPQVGIPNMKKIIPERRLRRQFRLHLATLFTLLAAVAWPVLARPAGVLAVVSAGLLAANLLGALGVYRQVAGSGD